LDGAGASSWGFGFMFRRFFTVASNFDNYQAPPIEGLPEWFKAAPYRPTDSIAGHDEPHNLYHCVGMICTNWEVLEESLFSVYIALMMLAHSREINLGAIIAPFSALTSSSARRDVIQELTDTLFFVPTTPIRKHIRRDLLAVSRAVGLRNRVAHGTVKMLNGEYMLVPPSYNPRNVLWPSADEFPVLMKFTFNLESLDQINMALYAITTAVRDTARKIEQRELCSLR
jgi:hypothetical protein